MGKGELEVLLEELLDVRAADVGGLLNLNDLEDLRGMLALLTGALSRRRHTWIDLKRARWRAAMSW